MKQCVALILLSAGILPLSASSSPVIAPQELMHLTGESACGAFGFSLASAGDMNGDGRDDLIIGAPFASFSQGHAYIYLGNSQTTPQLRTRLFVGGNTAHFGIQVAGAGDFNADGFDDVVVAAGN